MSLLIHSVLSENRVRRTFEDPNAQSLITHLVTEMEHQAPMSVRAAVLSIMVPLLKMHSRYVDKRPPDHSPWFSDDQRRSWRTYIWTQENKGLSTFYHISRQSVCLILQTRCGFVERKV